MPTDTPTDTPADTSSLAPTDTPQDTSSLAPTDTPADDTQSSEPTDTPAPTDTPEPTGTSSATAPKTLTPAAIKGTANVTDTLSLRATPSSTASILDKIPKDGQFTVMAVSTTKGWLKIKYSGKTGYVLAQYVSIGTGGTDKVCTVISGPLNVRSGAGKTHSVLGVLNSGATVVYGSEVKASDGTNWLKITVGSKTGYIDESLCRMES
jgi:uncharacterized protein YgiM (DUF1202 family)